MVNGSLSNGKLGHTASTTQKETKITTYFSPSRLVPLQVSQKEVEVILGGCDIELLVNLFGMETFSFHIQKLSIFLKSMYP